MTCSSSKLKVQSSREVPKAKAQLSNGVPAPGVGWPEAEAIVSLVFREESPAAEKRHPWDLEERTSAFGEQVVRFSKKIPRDPTNNRLIDQLVGAGTSVGANYCEANQAVSRNDFKYTISRCVKEAKETKFFLRMIAASEPGLAEEARTLYREAHELLLIFASMRKS